MTLPVALTGTDVIGQAKTGTGKTLGFGLPILERVTVPVDIEAGRAKPEQLTEAPQALIVVPTRELCQQVTNDLLTAGKVRNVRVLAIYGGRAYEPQVEALQKGVDVVVGTPGRLLDLAGQRKLDLSHIKTLVLDEADEMLDLGFLPDVEKIINMLPPKRQTMLFSATMPGAVIGLARRYMSQPTHIRATSPDDEGVTHANITQHVYRAHNMDKPEMVARILQARGRGLAMIFCRTKRTAADIAEQLQRRGFASGAVHGDLGQGAREQALRAFRNGKVDVLVCTDVAARGIDVEGVTHVINYQTPEDEKTYLHRTGRTGRAGNTGTAITLVDWDDIPRWQLINKALELDFHNPVETYSSSPHFYAELDIPEGTKGILPRSERTRAGLAAEELEDLGEPGGRRARGGRTEAPAEERPARTPRQRRRTRGGADDAPVTEAPAPEQESAEGPRRPRRRRTRGTGPVGGGIPVAGTAPVTAEAPAAEVVETAAAKTVEAPAAAAPVAVPAADEQPSGDGRTRRRRSRGGRPEAETAPAEAPVTEAPAAEAPAAVEAPAEAPAEESAPRRRRGRGGRPEAEAPAPATEAPAAETGPRRRRGRGGRPEAVAAPAAPAPAAAPAPRKRRVRPRAEETVFFQTVETAAAELAAARRQPAPAAAPVAVPAQTAVEPVAPRAAEAAPVQAPLSAVPAQAPSGPRVRRRATRPVSTPGAVVETAPAVVEAPAPAPVEEPPARTRRRAVRKASSPVTATAAAEAVLVIPAPVEEAPAPVAETAPVEEAPKAPRKRAAAKKTAAVVEEAPAEEAPKAPRKRTAAKKTAAAEAPAATEEAPKAPRKRAAAKKTAAVVEETPVKEAPKAPRKRAAAKKAVATEALAEEAPKAPRKRAAAKKTAAVVEETPVEEAPKAPRKRAAAKKAVAATEAPAEEAPKAPRKRAAAKKTAAAQPEA
ncbi:DEAD/DEAH box helicase [Streptomyces termitum]